MLGRERSYRTEDGGEQGCERLLSEKELFQLGEIVWRDVGNRAESEAVLLPGEPVVALGFAGAIPVAFRRSRFHEDIDDVLAAGVDEGGDGFAAGYVEASADQWEPVVGEVADRWGEINAAVEPGFDRVLIGGLDIGEMAGLQGAKMGIHE